MYNLFRAELWIIHAYFYMFTNGSYWVLYILQIYNTRLAKNFKLDKLIYVNENIDSSATWGSPKRKGGHYRAPFLFPRQYNYPGLVCIFHYSYTRSHAHWSIVQVENAKSLIKVYNDTVPTINGPPGSLIA